MTHNQKGGGEYCPIVVFNRDSVGFVQYGSSSAQSSVRYSFHNFNAFSFTLIIHIKHEVELFLVMPCILCSCIVICTSTGNSTTATVCLVMMVVDHN